MRHFAVVGGNGVAAEMVLVLEMMLVVWMVLVFGMVVRGGAFRRKCFCPGIWGTDAVAGR